MMKKLILCSILAATACTEDPGEEIIPPAGCATGSLQCSGNNVQRCDNNTWSDFRTCSISCTVDGGTAGCIDRDGHVGTTVTATADINLAPGYQNINSSNNDEQVLFENYLGYGRAVDPGETVTGIPIEGDDTVFDLCGVCVRAFAGARIYMPRSGSIDVTLGEFPGDPMSITFHNVMMRQVRIDANTAETTDVEGGQRWRLDGVTISANAQAFRCDDSNPPLVDGATLCAGTWLYGCNDEVTTDNVPGTLDGIVDCDATNQICAGTASGGVCTTTCTTAQRGTSRCNADRAETCTAVGNSSAWIPTLTCTDGDICFQNGDDRICAEPCDTPDAERCTGTSRELCNGQVWLATENCADTGFICEEDTGTTSCVAEPCVAGTDSFRCVANVLQECDATDSRWLVREDCGEFYTCDETGVCAASSCDTADAQRCAGNVPQTCTTGAWADAAACTDFCRMNAGEAYCAEACDTPDALRCAAADWLERCDGTAWLRYRDCASFEPVATCYDSACVEACTGTDGDTRCTNTTVDTCSTGRWIPGENCAALGQDCVQSDTTTAACERQDCLPEQDSNTRCVGDRLQVCDGTSWGGSVDTDCADTGRRCALYDTSSSQQACVEACTSGTDTTRCNADGDIETCSSEFQFWQKTMDCPTTCTSGICD
jgi:hypothetical protein